MAKIGFTFHARKAKIDYLSYNSLNYMEIKSKKTCDRRGKRVERHGHIWPMVKYDQTPENSAEGG
jgi:hypothetical protein